MSETQAEPRPRRMTSGIALIAATKIARKLVEGGHIDHSEVTGMAKAITMHAKGPFTDGYSIAKALDDYEGCECNFAMVEILNEFSDEVREEIRIAEKAWFDRVKPQPPFAIGARIAIGDGETGEITEIYGYGPAKYCVKVDGDPDARPPKNSRRIVNFEDARASP